MKSITLGTITWQPFHLIGKGPFSNFILNFVRLQSSLRLGLLVFKALYRLDCKMLNSINLIGQQSPRIMLRALVLHPIQRANRLQKLVGSIFSEKKNNYRKVPLRPQGRLVFSTLHCGKNVVCKTKATLLRKKKTKKKLKEEQNQGTDREK